MSNSPGTKRRLRDYECGPPTWCPGCGDFGIWTALKQALVELDLAPDRVLIVYGIGCSGNMMNFVKTYGFHGLHGRPLPVAVGARIANHDLPIIVVAGDGDGYGEGIGHFLHTMRANPNLTYLVHDNQVYGLTKGQHAPTASQGFVSPTAPEGVTDLPVNPIALALAGQASFVSRGYAGDVRHLTGLITAAIEHRGFALVDVLQPCVTYNHLNTYAWFRQRVYNLVEAGHDPTDLPAAWQRATEDWNERLPIGVFYRAERPTLEEQLTPLKAGPLVSQTATRDLASLLKRFR